MKLKINSFIILLFVCFLAAAILPACAQEDVNALKKEIETLKQRVAELESQPQPGLSPFRQEGWDPFAEMERMEQEMDRLFSNAFSDQSVPPTGMFTNDMVFNQDLDLKETDQGYEIRFDMAGLDKEKMDIQVNKNSITVSGQYSEEHKEENPNSRMQSQRFGTFLKTIPLPVDANVDQMKTEQKGNELVITVPKK